MKNLIAIFIAFFATFLLLSCGEPPIAELEAQLAKETNPIRRKNFSSLIQILKQERAGLSFDSTRGLELSVIFDYPDLVEFFIKKGANVNNGALVAASERHFLEICEILISYGADVNSRDTFGNTPLMAAIANRQYNVTSSSRRIEAGNFAIRAEQEREKLIKLLFEKGADINAKAKDGSTALLYAVASGDSKITKWLIRKGAVVRVWVKDGPTPWFFSWTQPPISIAHQIKGGLSPLHFALCGPSKSLDTLNTLLDAGANPNEGLGLGLENSLLKLALDESGGEDFSTAESLIKHGAEVNVPSILCHYVKENNVNVVEFLLKNNADPNATWISEHTGYEESALTLAIKNKNSTIIRLLIDAGATPDKKRTNKK